MSVIKTSRYKTLNLIQGNRFVIIDFKKKDGSLRTIKCSYEDDQYPDKSIILVYDLDLMEYRNVNLETIINIKIKDKEYLVS